MFFTFRDKVLDEKSNLSRREAEEKLQAYPNKEARNNTFVLPNNREYLLALKEAGYIPGWEELGSFLGNLVFKLEESTDKGKQFLEPGIGAVYVLCADFNSEIEITGITIDSGGVTVTTKFAVAPSEPLRILRTIEGLEGREVSRLLPGKAEFRRYDDGWRIEAVELERDQGTLQLLKQAGAMDEQKAKMEHARVQIENLGAALDTFRLDIGRYPTSQEGLDALRERPSGVDRWDGPYLKKEVPRDPWGNAYVYRSPGNKEPYELQSYGADGIAGGSGDGADIK